MTPIGSRTNCICAVSRNGINSGIGKSRVAVPNAWPKSIPIKVKVFVSIKVFAKCRSPMPRIQ